MSNKIPPLLEQHLALPREASLTILANTLGASSNWLVLRYLYSILLQPGRGEHAGVGETDAGPGVVFLSFMRDLAFWREGASRMVRILFFFFFFFFIFFIVFLLLAAYVE
jgi:elongator complex protein 6